MIVWHKIVVLTALAAAVFPHSAQAQDVPGIEICTAEKTMERRTGCLQSNVNFLQSGLSKLTVESQRKLDAANRQIEALKGAVTELQKTVGELQRAQAGKTDAPAAGAVKAEPDDAVKKDSKPDASGNPAPAAK